ncbi:MAG TPA: hypothetical protein VKP30_18020, partial [Polyangiaceae bacterium]|nr:hypothetical protein [Polyangiaceae bacterium]
MPLLLGLILRTERVRAWTEQQTALLLRNELGIEANYRARINLWPLEVRLEQLVIAATDGGSPALTVQEVRLAPRLFSLFAGKIDIGEVKLEQPRIRLVVESGSVKNVRYQLPKSRSERSTPLKEAPFSSIAVSDARLDLILDGRRIETSAVDIDVTAQRGPAFEISARTVGTKHTHYRVGAFSNSTASFVATDEDLLCNLDLRVRVTESTALIRRLSVFGLVDLDSKPDTRPSCVSARDDDVAALVLRASQVGVDWSSGKPTVEGQLEVRVPVPLVNRFVSFLPVSGWVGLQGHGRWDTSMQLPAFEGQLRAESLVLDKYHLGRELSAQLSLSSEEIVVPHLELMMADGRTEIENIRVSPFQPDIPFAAESVRVHGVKFPGLMRDLGVTEKTIVAWDFGNTTVTNFHGRLALPELEGHIHAVTRDFEVFDRGFADPARRHMLSVDQGTVDGRILVRPTALEFRDCWVSFGQSRILVGLVGIGFANELEITIADNSVINLSDISPITTIPISGRAKVGARLRGLSRDPVLLGKLSVADLVFGGFPIGDIQSANAKFWPLKVDLTDVKAQKGQSPFTVDHARLDFDQDASVVIDASAKSKNLNVRDFLAMWNMADDPRWADVAGGGAVDAKIHYAYGGHEDVCAGGNLRIDAKLGLNHAELFGERYDSAEGELALAWSDMQAGFLGLSLDVPQLQLRKGPGAIIGSLQVRPGAKLTGQAVATKLPLSRFDVMQPWAAELEGELSAVAELGGTL